MSIFNFIHSKFRRKDNDFIDCAKYIDLETPCLIDENAIITRGGGRMTLIKVNGHMNLVGEAGGKEFEKTCNNILSFLKVLYNNDQDVQLTWTFEQDPLNTARELEEIVRPSLNTAHRHGLDIDETMEELRQGNIKLCMSQDSYIAVWTTPTPQQEYVDGKLTTVETENTPIMRVHERLFSGAANPFLSDIQTIRKHTSYVERVLDRLRDADVICEALKSESASTLIHYKLNRNAHKFTPLVFPKKSSDYDFASSTPILNPTTGSIDLSEFMAPPLAEQLSRNGIYETERDGILEKDGFFYSTHTFDVFPRQKVSFNVLRNALKKVPFRISFQIKPKPTGMILSAHEMMNDLLGGLSEKNRESYRQVQLLKKMQEEHDCPTVLVQVLLTTWGETEQDAIRHGAIINDAIVDWGGARMDNDNISPYQTFFSGIAGVSAESHSQGFLMSVDKLVPLLPHQLESSLNDYGPIVFRHESGKIIPFDPNSTLQDYDFTIYLARPRQGKSLLMNAKSIAKLLAEGSMHLPLVTSIDIGPSSEGALQLIRLFLERYVGKERAKQLVVSQLWDPSSSGWYYNPSDIRFGRRLPNQQEREFIKNFYCSVCAEVETGLPPKGGDEILQAVIEKVFYKLSEPAHEKIYSRAFAPELVDLADKYKVKLQIPDPVDKDKQKGKSYFDLRDEFFARGCMTGASLCHRMAMPTVDDYINLLSSDSEIGTRFEKTYGACKDMLSHKLRNHLQDKPHLCKPTTLDFAQAKIISFDLKPIAEAGTDNASRIRLFTEYLLAMNVGMNKFFINDSILEGMDTMYHSYWKKQIAEFGQVDKCLNLDEWHTLTVKQLSDNEEISVPVAGAQYIDWLIKQAPKWRLNVNMASHSAADFTTTMKDNATNVFIYSGIKGRELERIKKDFSLSETQVKALASLHSPDERGSQMLWLYTVKVPHMKSVRGSAKIEYLCNGSMLWGLNTSATDLPHKLRLEREHGDKPWLRALCHSFPTGSMSKHRQGLTEKLRESSIAAEAMTKGIEERLYDRAVESIFVLEHGQDVIDDARIIEQRS